MDYAAVRSRCVRWITLATLARSYRDLGAISLRRGVEAELSEDLIDEVDAHLAVVVAGRADDGILGNVRAGTSEAELRGKPWPAPTTHGPYICGLRGVAGPAG